MNICIIVPVYNHQEAITKVVDELKRTGLFCILVNDGSSEECSAVLKDIASQEKQWIHLLERNSNGGKGAAVIDGFKCAIKKGFSHAIQIDADGQHNIADVSLFVKASKQHPQKLILGRPLFDESIPRKRRYGRILTNIWIWINTVSFSIADGMCGFRCYPLAAVNTLLKSVKLGRGMDFDIDIVVQLYWQGVNVVNLPTEVRYPTDGVSHFKMLQDNICISKKHAQLFFCMLPQFFSLLLKRK